MSDTTRYDAHVTPRVVDTGATWWHVAYTCDGRHVVECGLDVHASTLSDALRYALEHQHAKLTTCHEMDASTTNYYAHQLHQLNALMRYASRVGVAPDSEIMVD